MTHRHTVERASVPTRSERGLDRDVVRMANQIARQFAHLPEGEAGAKVAYHLHAFWEPRMLLELERHLEELEPAAVMAVRSLGSGTS
jgi:formate dehydrogenase subunit delta